MKQFGIRDVLRMPHVEHATTGHEYFSLADAGQYEEEIIEGYRGDIDANAQLPPLLHDVYSVRVSYAEKWPDGEVLAEDPGRRWQKKLDRNSTVYYCTWVKLVTENNVDPASDGRESTEFMSTLAMKRGTTNAQALLQGLGVDTLTLGSHQAQMRALDEKLAGEGSITGVELDWEATVFDKEAVQRDKKTGEPIKDENGNEKKGVELWRLRGMKKFPANADGTYNPEIGKDDGHTYRLPGLAAGDVSTQTVTDARARNFRRRWVPVGKLTGSGSGKPEQQQQAQAAAPVQAQQSARPAAPVQTRPAAPVRPAPVRRVSA